MFGKNNQRGITWKLLTRNICPNLIHILIKLHEAIPNHYRGMVQTRISGKNKQRGITWKLRKGEQSSLCATSCPVPIHIPIKLHDDIFNGYFVME